MPLYFQQPRGYSALTAGLLLVPQGVGSILPRTTVGKLTDRFGPRAVSLAGIVLFGHTFWWCVGFTARAIIPALALPGRPVAPSPADGPGTSAAARSAPAR
jgi:MFS family permease